MQHGTGAEPSLCGLPRTPHRRISGSAQFHPSVPSPASRARNLNPSVLRNWGICNHDTVEILHPPAPQEIHHVWSLFGPARVYEVLFAARLHEHPIPLPHVYKADGERARGRRRSAAERPPAGYEAAGGREEDQGQQERREEARCLPRETRRSLLNAPCRGHTLFLELPGGCFSRESGREGRGDQSKKGNAQRMKRRSPSCYRPSGVRRSIHSSASARVRSASGLPMRFSSRSMPFSPRHSTASVLRRSTWLLRALPAAALRGPLFLGGAIFGAGVRLGVADRGGAAALGTA